MPTKNIEIRKETYELLNQLRLEGETMDDVIVRILRNAVGNQSYVELEYEENKLKPSPEEKREHLEKTISECH